MRLFCVKYGLLTSPLSRPVSKINHLMTRSFSMSHTESSSRIHVLGLGSIGTFTAHGLSEIPSRPSVTLLLHRESLLGGYQENGNQILLTTREGFQIGYSGYDLEVHRTNGWYPEPSSPSSEAINSSISHLIISVKATQTVSALQPLKHRLDAKSTILFLQNGSGMIDEVNESLFPDPQTRPNYIIGVISHGVTLNRPFDVTHTGFAAMSLGLVPRSEEAPQPQEFSSSYLLDNLPLSPRLNATSYPYTKVLQIQLEKLAVNAFCNPLCALNDAKNGFLFTLPDTRREILTEISNVVLALPELRDVPGVEERFAVDRLEATVNAILTKTAETTCSMVWDLRAGRETEVRFINGYWVKRGGEVGVRTPVNEYLVEKVTKRSRRELK